MVAAFKDWVAKWGVQNASFAAMRGDAVIGQAKTGDRKPTDIEPLASLSKAITGVCIVKLVEDGELSYGARLGKLIPDYFKAHKPADPAAKQITIRELLTQTSGIGYDPTQGTPEFAALDFSKKNFEETLSLALARPLSSKTHYYNNVNYGALGLVIETVTGKAYEKHCNKSVLVAAGVIDAKMDPDWRIMNSWGGWRLSAVDYAKFLGHFHPKDKLLTSKPTAWPKTDLGGGAFYSVGTMLRESRSSYNFWHSGAWRWTSPNMPERNEDYGTYYAMWFQDVRFAANYAPQPPSGAVGDLDYAMYVAAYPDAAASIARAARPAIAPPAPIEDGSDRGLEDREIGARMQ